MGSLRNKITEKKNDLKKYNLNLEAIELNKKVDIEVSKVKTDLSVCEHTKDDTITRIERVQTDIKSHKSNIETKTKLIETIKKEEEIDKIFKIYIDLVGKKGISKLVLRSVLPIINSEAQRLLEDVVDFEIEIFMNEKNDVQFLLNKDGVSKLLKSGSGLEKTASSLALRAVLGKLSTLPMPNFITFDEVLGKVAPENIEKLKNIFDKIKDMYEIVFFITHNDLVKDWGDNVVTVIKDSSNISKITIK
jgi:DNA repair exonuclease SbcCD ATPase subunit